MVSAEHAPRSLDVAGFGCLRNGRVLLRQIDFSLQAGQVLQLKGSNGAGKSTLLRSLAGLMPWRVGALAWCGQRVIASSPAFQRQLSYLGHQCGMSDALSGIENLRFALQMQAVPWSGERAAQVLRALDVLDVAARPFGRLSQGQRRRVAIARVLLSERPLWLLDEPDNALDAQGSALLVQLLSAHAQAGGLAMVVSHRGLLVPGVPALVLDLSAPSAAPAQQEVPC